MTGQPRVAMLATIRRLPGYLNLLKEYAKEGHTAVSATWLSKRMQMEAISVRKDLSSLGVEGKPRIGFPLPELIAAIEEFLNWDNRTEAFVVGVGHLGAALLGHKDFEERNLNILAGFDNDPAKTGTQFHGKPVFGMEKLPNLVERMHVQVGILTVPPEVAIDVATQMMDAGIRAIWNFTPVKLPAREGVVVHDEDLSVGFAVLSVKLAQLDEN